MKNPGERVRYFLVLGEMVYNFAQAEYAVFFFLFKRAGMSPQEAAALLNTTRIATCIDMTRRLFRARSEELPTAVASCLDQFKVVNDFRNLLLHYGPYVLDGAVVTSNWPVSLPDLELKPTPAEIETIKMVTADLASIIWVLFDYAEGDPSEPISTLAHYQKAQEREWQYIPPQQSKKNRAPLKSRAGRKPKALPQSSPE